MKSTLTIQIVEDIKRVARALHVTELSRSEYLQHGRFTTYQLYDNDQTWNSLCVLAGIKSKTKVQVPDETYYERLKEMVNKHGRYPKTSERKKFSLNMSKRRFPTLNTFIKKAVELHYVPNLFHSQKLNSSEKTYISVPSDILELIRSSLKRDGRQARTIPPIPSKSKRKKWTRIEIDGFPYAPHEELGVVALFAISCAKGILPWQILELNSGKGIDVICYDEKEGREIRVELKYLLSKGSWNHPIEALDYVVCWENRWRDFPKPVIELSKLLTFQNT